VRVARRHDTLASYLRAIKAASAVPVAEGGYGGGSNFHEYEGTEQGMRVARFTGREFLGQVGSVTASAGAITWTAGARMGVFPMTPTALGGRPLLMAQTYEMFKFRRIRIIYAGTVPSLTAGAIALYYYSDPSEIGAIVGLSNMQHASSYGNFIQFKVWDNATLECKPNSFIKNYDDSATTDPLFAIQGAVVALAATDFVTGGTSPINMGNLYIEYELEFRGQGLTADLTPIEMIGMRFTANATVGACQTGAVITASGVASTGNLLASIAPSASDLGYWFVGTITAVAGEFSTMNPPPKWHTSLEPSEKSFLVGQMWLARVVEYNNSGTAAYIYDFTASLASLDEGMDANSSAHMPNQLTWATDATFTAATGTFDVLWRKIPIGN
jgi:hypothetical protein